MDLSRYSPKDQSIIKHNPSLTPYELLKLGLSESGYKRLINDLNEAKDAERQQAEEQKQEPVQQEGEEPITPNSIEPVKEKSQPHMPKLNQPQDYARTTRKVRNPSGMVNSMVAKWALWLTTKYPNEYKLVDDE